MNDNDKDDSEYIVGRYIMYKEQGQEEILKAMGYNYPSRMSIMNATRYLQMKKFGEYWQMTESYKSVVVKMSCSLTFWSGKEFSWTASNGSKMKSLITKVGKGRFEFRHEPIDPQQEYKTLLGKVEFFENGEMVTKIKLEEVDGLEAVFEFRKYDLNSI